MIDHVRAPVPDGITLATDLVYEEGQNPRPALLFRTPYLRSTVRQDVDVVALAQEGWVVVIQDTRGRGGSDGRFDPFVQERTDGAATIAWCARQPWCDGRVAMAGWSYLGYAQWAAAAGGPPALRAISPTITSPAIFEPWHYVGGARCHGMVTAWAAWMASADPRLPAQERRRAGALSADPDALLRLPPKDHPLRTLMPAYERWLDPGDRRYWSQLDTSRMFHRMDIAAFGIAGWYDLFCEGNIQAWQGMTEHAPSAYARASQRLVIGPWAHTPVGLPIVSELDFGPAANSLADGTAMRSFTWLRDAVDGKPVEGGVRAFVMGSNAWRELDDWPPVSTPIDLYLSSGTSARSLRGDGQLELRPQSAGFDRFLHDPDQPVPTRGGRIQGPWLPAPGPCDQRPVEERDDVLVYTSAVLATEVTIMGMVQASIVFETTGCSADVTVKLVDVYPDGRAFNVVDGIRREAFTPGRSRVVRVDVGSIAQAFRPGHRIRIEIASSNFPHYDRNPSTSLEPSEVAHYVPAQQTVYHGGRARSRVRLPVVEGSL